MTKPALATAAFICLAAGGLAAAQDPPPPPAPTPAPTAGASEAEAGEKEKIPYRPIESNVIVALPSVDVPAAGTLTFLVTHRFIERPVARQHQQLLHARQREHLGIRALVLPDRQPQRGVLPHVGARDLRGLGAVRAAEARWIRVLLRVGEDWRTEVFEQQHDPSPVAASRSRASSPRPSWPIRSVRMSASPRCRPSCSAHDRAYRDFDSPPPGDLSCRSTGNPLRGCRNTSARASTKASSTCRWRRRSPSRAPSRCTAR